MSLSCSCSEWDGDGWWYETPEEYAPLATKRARKCCSCEARIAVGDLSMRFPRFCNTDEDSVSYRINGDTMQLATWYMCEGCADQYLNLTALGFCITLGADNMMDLIREYADMNRRTREART